MASTNAIGGTGSSTSTSSTSGLGAMDGNAFLTLLTAQLKSQDPENAQDPSTFVTQLAQFSSLEQLIGIRSTLNSGLGTSDSTSTK